MSIRLSSIFILFNVFFIVQIKAQEKFDLKQCIDYGLKNNPSSVISFNDKRIADAKAKESLAAYLPNLNFSGTVDDNLKVQEQVIPAGLFGDQDIRVAFTKKFTTNGSVQLDQTIYDQSQILALNANKLLRQQADLNLKKTKESVIYNISTSYYQIFVYQEQLELLKINLETYSKQLEIVALKVKKGVALQKDMDKVQVDYNNTLSQIRVAETNIILAENQLKYEMGFPMQTKLEIEKLEINRIDVTAELENDLNFENISDRELDKLNAELLKVDEKSIRAGFLPKLSFYARYGWNGFGDDLGQSFSSLRSFSAIGIKLAIPLFDGFKRKSQYTQAKLKYANALETNKLNEGKYQLDYENSVSKLYKAESDIENDKRNMELSRSIFNVTDLQYQKGVTDTKDWLDSQNSLKSSQNTYLTSLYNFFQSKVDLEKAKGTLVQFYNSL
ncbi:TolC family protein [Elizabethkingia meningoseptica]|uniref:TolC family protein n=1 Tax=Elizabethkingia meningoseptica TaxID=238 RepID=UPI0022F17561|nr:TolC family protein [Elizabethkingia meningoseptica]EJK5328123.1 TolC family protein [Elizabethkingia meningoseptica]MCT3897517.1 TolC family protein [Elizabethkingia anophelis]WBS74113.1 TolC family protein [Elizabethkingia meningoseptica]